MLRHFRAELYEWMRVQGYEDLREAHMQVFGNIDGRGARLTELATRANMTLAAMSELVNDLEDAGYLERRSDPSDGRAKLILLTDRGRQAVRTALRHVVEMEAEWGDRIGRKRFESMAYALQDLQKSLAAEEPRTAKR